MFKYLKLLEGLQPHCLVTPIPEDPKDKWLLASIFRKKPYAKSLFEWYRDSGKNLAITYISDKANFMYVNVADVGEIDLGVLFVYDIPLEFYREFHEYSTILNLDAYTYLINKISDGCFEMYKRELSTKEL